MTGENNQFINDDGSSQKLTKDAIMDLKAKGFEGEVCTLFLKKCRPIVWKLTRGGII